MIKQILNNKKLAIGTLMTVLVVLSIFSLGLALLIQGDNPPTYGFGVIAFSLITFWTIKINSDEALSTGEDKGWSDAY
jgi:hypothetical protein